MKSILPIFLLSCHWIGLLATPVPEIENLPTPYNELVEILPYNSHGFYANRSEMEKLLAQHKPKCVIELGSWLGQSTCHIASCLPEDGKVYAIDHWLGSEEHQTPKRKDVSHLLPTLYQQFLSNVIHKGLYRKIIPWKMTTKDAVAYAQQKGLPIDLVYVDASQDEESVYNDLCNWYPFVKDSGILCGDDWQWGKEKGYPVRRAVKRFALENNLIPIPSNTFWVLKKQKEIADWQVDQLESEFASIDPQNFSRETILRSYLASRRKWESKGNETRGYLVEICDNQKIYIDGILAENLECNLAKFMLDLKDKMSFLPPCCFIYTRNGKNLLKHKRLKNVPVLVGSKFSSLLKNQITFVEECSTVDLSDDQKEWSHTHCTKEVLKNRDKLTWEQKIPTCFWRGFLSDNTHHQTVQIPNGLSVTISPRMIIHILGHFYPEFIDAKITNIHRTENPNEWPPEIVHFLSSEKNDYPSMPLMHGIIQLNARKRIESHLKYRYQIALDGEHATNPGYLWRLLSGCLVFKQESPYSQWFYAGLKPNVHFIPVNRNLSDLVNKIQYARNNDAECKKIATQGREFAETYLSLDKFFDHAYYVLLKFSQQQQKVCSNFSEHIAPKR
ncbi:MAG: glycosyl transferase family 90 [Simkaniaceae bacterium]|nr:glycosyl transferase family 90 [Simkaniaceae bacterium]